jgi:head-tail adaptor
MRSGDARWPIVILVRTGADEYGAASTKWIQFAPPINPLPAGPMPQWGGDTASPGGVMTGWGGLGAEQSYPAGFLVAAKEPISGSEKIEAETLEQNVSPWRFRIHYVEGVTTDMRIREITDPANPVDYQIHAALDVDGLKRQLSLTSVRLKEVSQIG